MAIDFRKTHQKRKIICSEMAGTSPLTTEGHIIIATLLLVSISFQLGVFGAPVPQTPLSTQEGSQTARKLLQWAIEHSFPTNTSRTLSSELRQTQFYHLVCPMFVNYTRFNLTLGHISENDTNHVKLSLITFLLKKSMELTCENVKRKCTTSGDCSNLECTTSSIANLCLQAPPQVLAQGFGPPQENILLETARQPQLIQSWIRENMAGRDPDDRLLVNLKTMLSQVALLNCTDSRPEHIVCYHHLPF